MSASPGPKPFTSELADEAQKAAKDAAKDATRVAKDAAAVAKEAAAAAWVETFPGAHSAGGAVIPPK